MASAGAMVNSTGLRAATACPAIFASTGRLRAFALSAFSAFLSAFLPTLLSAFFLPSFGPGHHQLLGFRELPLEHRRDLVRVDVGDDRKVAQEERYCTGAIGSAP